jgi:hypothetical protein
MFSTLNILNKKIKLMEHFGSKMTYSWIKWHASIIFGAMGGTEILKVEVLKVMDAMWDTKGTLKIHRDITSIKVEIIYIIYMFKLG